MKKVLILLLTIATNFAIAQKSEVRSVGPFSAVSAAEGIDVFLKRGDKPGVRVEVSEGADLSRVVTEVSGSYLKIHMSSGRHVGNISARVYVTYVSINKVVASSAANVYSEEVIRSDEFEVSASSAASIELKLDVGNLEASASSAADIELEGKAKRAEFEISSAAKLDAYDLEVGSLDVDASSAGSAKVNVTSEFTAEASSGADIKYRGNPAKSRTNASSGGSVKKSY